MQTKKVYLRKEGSEVTVSGPSAQSAERGADNAKVLSTTLTRTNCLFFLSKRAGNF